MRVEGNDPFVSSQLKVQNNEQPEKEQLLNNVEPFKRVRDRLEFSTRSREIEGYERAAKEAPEVRAERVAEVARSVEAGTYNIKAEKIAESIISGSILDELA